MRSYIIHMAGDQKRASESARAQSFEKLINGDVAYGVSGDIRLRNQHSHHWDEGHTTRRHHRHTEQELAPPDLRARPDFIQQPDCGSQHQGCEQKVEMEHHRKAQPRGGGRPGPLVFQPMNEEQDAGERESNRNCVGLASVEALAICGLDAATASASQAVPCPNHPDAIR